MKYARLINDIAVEVFTPHEDFSIADCFPPEHAAQFIECPESTVVGATLSGSTWANPVTPPPAVSPPLPPLTPMQFYLAFTPSERVAIKSSTDALVKEFWATYELAVQLGHSIDPNLSSVSDGLDYLVADGCLVAIRKADILAGVAK